MYLSTSLDFYSPDSLNALSSHPLLSLNICCYSSLIKKWQGLECLKELELGKKNIGDEYEQGEDNDVKIATNGRERIERLGRLGVITVDMIEEMKKLQQLKHLSLQGLSDPQLTLILSNLPHLISSHFTHSWYISHYLVRCNVTQYFLKQLSFKIYNLQELVLDNKVDTINLKQLKHLERYGETLRRLVMSMIWTKQMAMIRKMQRELQGL